MSSYLDRPLREYLDDAAADKPTPGGGSVAALVGALATTMASMAGNFTAGREKYQDVEPRVRADLAVLAEARTAFVDLMHKDMAAYGAVMEAYRQPKGTDAEKAARAAAIQKALAESMQVPLAATRLAERTLEAAVELANIANANLLSDVAVAAVLAEAAFAASRVNVEVNLAGIKDQRLAAETARELDERQDTVAGLRQECLEAIRARQR
ncbi:MAG TPA: cyclodeaminase/cyclohydrolase family protein [Phycisphaerae bacterium]|nr:cyclodeaminase/cyclohydrolase family protein [Phycisphaerae bacterium]HOI54700.1 cyclodeaminase/cyclohydrolase family protein [Phycisphaerae bacterium]